MRIGLLSGKRSGWHVEALRHAFEIRGAGTVDVPVTALRARVGMGRFAAPEPSGSGAAVAAMPAIGWAVDGGGEDALEGCDAVVVRALPGGSLEQVIYRVDLLHRLGSLGVQVVNSAAAIERCVDKFHTLTLLEQAGLAVPRTLVAERYADAQAAFAELGGDVVVKPLFGSEGRGMVRVSDPDLAHRSFRALELGRYVFYLQQFVSHGDGDLRAFVVGDRVVAAMRRRAPGWKSNVAVGAQAEAVTLRPQIEEQAVRAAHAVGADYAGVDLLPADDGTLYVIEVNSIPGWQALQNATRCDVAGEVATYVLRRLAVGC